MGGVDNTPGTDQSPFNPPDDGLAKRHDRDSSGKPRRQQGGSESAVGTFETDLTNQQIGRYLIQRKLGSGGTAVVYQAYDQVRGRSVALKVLASTADEKMLLRFRREAMTSGALHHSNIVRTLQVGIAPHGDAAYIAMELVEGESLSALLERCGYLDSDEAAALLAPIAQALAHAHENEIIHRDVKPSNILLQPSGVGGGGRSSAFNRGSASESTGPATRSSVHIDVLDYPVVPMLSDFGIARSLDSPELTNQGRTVGTPAYMAPEQCAGKRDIDGRADIYSLGAVLYRCVVGRQPFLGATPQILHAHVYEPLTIDDDILRRLPPLVVEILIRSMAKHPDERYPNALEMALALAEAGGYDFGIANLDSAPAPTATITLDDLQTTTGTTSSSASILIPGSAPKTTSGDILYPTGTPLGVDSVPAPSGYASPNSSRPGELPSAQRNLQRWSSIALLFVGVLVGAITALYISGAFTRVDLPFGLGIRPTAPAEQNISSEGGQEDGGDLPEDGSQDGDSQNGGSQNGDAGNGITASDETPEVGEGSAGILASTETPRTPTSANVPLATSTVLPPLTVAPAASVTNTAQNAETSTPTLVSTNIATATPTYSPTPTPTETPTITATPLATNTPIVPPSPTWTPPGAATATATQSPTSTPDNSELATATDVPLPTATLLPPTPTWTPIP